VLFSGVAGDLSDRWSKGWLMWLCKVAEIVVMLAGLAVFALGRLEASGDGSAPAFLWALAAVVFLMGTQSAFFGPPKYGGLPELVRGSDIAQATGWTQMTTFLAIILGVAAAGQLVDWFGSRLYGHGLAAVAIAALGTWTARGIARRPPADERRVVDLRSAFSVLTTLRRTMREDPRLWRVMLAYAWFWLLGAVCITSANVYGRLQLGLDNRGTSLLLATLSLGIGAGSALVGRLSRSGVRMRLIVPGAAVLVVLLLALGLVPVHDPTPEDVEAFNRLKAAPEAAAAGGGIPLASGGARAAAYALFFLLGGAAGFYSVPLLAFVQMRPAARDKGRVFAASNWLTWVFILLAALLYGVGIRVFQSRAQDLLQAMGGLTLVACALLFPGVLRGDDERASRTA
jgi:acyl-[acyl-carrier-protein]-phospholipid O-acyltransferase/long-chain-fatty-acid--[acyl-carrier-protein] ligase